VQSLDTPAPGAEIAGVVQDIDGKPNLTLKERALLIT
jgi:hypothetical protein